MRGESGESGGILYWGSTDKEFSLSIGSSGEIVLVEAAVELYPGLLISWMVYGTMLLSQSHRTSHWTMLVVYVDNSVEINHRIGFHERCASILHPLAYSPLEEMRQEPTLNGYIDDVRVWERSLAASEVDKLYEIEKPTAPLEPEIIAPKITLQPTHQDTATGGVATFTVEATGKPEPRFTWQRQDKRKVEGHIRSR